MSRKIVYGALLFVLAGCSRDHRTPLVIYSPHGRDLLTLFEKRFESLHPDIDVRWLDMGSQDVYDRVRSERANPQADVWFGGPSLILEQAARDSLLDCHRAVWADAIPARARGAGDCYLATYETPALFLYAEKVVPPDLAPQDWDDLFDPKWKGKIIIRDPLASGTMRSVFGYIIARSLKQTGDTAAGFAWLRRLDGQTKVYEQNPALVSEKIARQEGLVTIWDLPDVLISRRRDRKSTRLNSSHLVISYAVFCLKKKNSMTSVQSDSSPGAPIFCIVNFPVASATHVLCKYPATRTSLSIHSMSTYNNIVASLHYQ